MPQSERKKEVQAKLSSELVSLVHHIELNRTGWWQLAVQRLTLLGLWLAPTGTTLDAHGIAITLTDQFGVEVGEALIREQLEMLGQTNNVVRLPSGEYKIAEAALGQLEEDLRAADALEHEAEARFRELVAERCPALATATIWQEFVDVFLLPLIKHLGANTYNLVTKTAFTQDAPFFQVLTDQFGKDNGPTLKQIAADFLDPGNATVRQFVLRLMNSYFFVQASSLDAKTVKALSANGTRFSAYIFVDTNFIFSLLGLHDNPADEAALTLLELVKKLSPEYKVKLYILPPTLDEATRVITQAQEAALKLRLPPSVIEVALETWTVSITQKFQKLAAASQRPIDAREYFGPFVKNLIAILRSKGVELFNQDLAPYKKRQDVIDDLLDRLRFEKNKYGSRSKPYEQLEHDCVLWHFVKDKRPVRTESPLETVYWIVTVDYRYLGFDAYLTRKAESAIPVCLHPAMLAQLLQFWVPRSVEFESALLSAMRLPLLFHEFDSNAEVVTIQILEALSRFENIGDLPKETVKTILVNDALRQRIAAEHDIKKQIELVREAVIEENRNVALRLKEADERAAALAQGQLLHGHASLSAVRRVASEADRAFRAGGVPGTAPTRL